MKKYTVKLDYVALKFSEAFTWQEFSQWVKTPLVDPDTGEKLGSTLGTHQYSLNFNGKDNVIGSFYKGGEIAAIELATNYDLFITRIDIALDIPVTSNAIMYNMIREYDSKIREKIGETKSTAKIITFEGGNKFEAGHKGHTYWSRGGDKQLRMYGKTDTVNPRVRLEWQLRGDLARQSFSAIKRDYPASLKMAFAAFQEVTSFYLGTDFFGLGKGDEIGLVKPVKVVNDSDFDSWILGTVARACVRHFHEDGKKAWEMLTRECEAIIIQEGDEQQAREKSYHDKISDKVSHQIARRKAEIEQIQ
jgi:hypothetical protein